MSAAFPRPPAPETPHIPPRPPARRWEGAIMEAHWGPPPAPPREPDRRPWAWLALGLTTALWTLILYGALWLAGPLDAVWGGGR